MERAKHRHLETSALETPPSAAASPLSFAQERLWWFGRAIGNAPTAMHLRGALNLEALEQALQAIVDRHALLRTRFQLHGATPVQEPVTGIAVALSLVDLQPAPASRRIRIAEDALAAAYEPSFDLQRPPLLRAHVLRLWPNHHVLLVTLSQMVADEWSRQLLTQDVADAYAACATGKPPRLPPVEAQYSDFALWERERLAGPLAEKDLAFWRTYLGDAPPLLHIPADHARQPRRTYHGGWKVRELTAPTAEQAKALARAEGVTAFHVLLAAFAGFLHRESGSKDVVVGTPFSRRPHARYDRVIGPFVNTVAIRARCAEATTFRAFVRHVRTQAVAALAHAHVPFELITAALRLRRDASYNPLVQVWFVYRPEAGPSARWEGPEVVPIELRPTSTPFDLGLSISEVGTALVCTCAYDTDLYEALTIDRLLDRWERFLLAVVADPGLPIDEYDLRSTEERHRHLALAEHTANRTTPVNGHPRLHDAIAAGALRSPDAIAVACETGAVTYSELMHAGRRLAARLEDAGVSRGSAVAVILDRSIDLVVAVLGILQCGAVAVPLDPGESAHQWQAVFDDAGVRCIVTSTASRRRVETCCASVVVMGEHSLQGAAQHARATEPARGTAPDDACFLLYSRGTSGEQAGVVVTHAGLINVLDHVRGELRVTPADSLLALMPLTVPFGVVELLLPLVSGARLVVGPTHLLARGPELRDRLARDDISMFHASSATWRDLVDAGWAAPPRFRGIASGPRLTQRTACDLTARVPDVWTYESTLEGIWAFQRLVADQAVDADRPIADTLAYVLDPRLQPVPVGVTGELYVAGPVVAREYHRRPAMTASRFLPDPFGRGSGRRMYATGALARYRDDGRIVRVGRRDHATTLCSPEDADRLAQVLETYPSVHSTVVVRSGPARDPLTIAYVRRPNDSAVTRAELWKHLAKYLPAYLLPSAIVMVDTWPRTDDGDIDVGALPPPSHDDLRTARVSVSPRTPTEQAVERMWQEVLGLETVGVDDDFFEVGGNSIQGMRMLLLIRSRLNADVAIQDFFEAPTVAGLAAHVDRLAGGTTRRSLQAIPRVPRDQPLAPAPQQENWWLNEYLTGNVNPFNVQFAVRINGPLQPIAVEQAIAGLQRRHESLRTMFVVRESGGPALIIRPAEDCDLRLSLVDLSHLTDVAQQEVLRELSALDQTRPFDLTHDLLYRARLVRLGRTDHVIMLTTHHLVCDGWSTDVLVRDFSTQYAASLRGEPAHLPELRFQYVDFAQWQREWLASPRCTAQLTYWKRQLAPPLADLLPPSAGGDFDVPYFAIRGRTGLRISPQATDAARRLARSERCTLFATFLATLKLLLYAHTNQRDLRVGTLSANRGLPGADHVVGLFTDIVCLRTHIDPPARFRDFIRAVHTTIGEASTQQDLPFEVLTRALEAGYGIDRSTLLQVMVLWRELPAVALDVARVGSSLYRNDREEATVVMVRNMLPLRIELLERPDDVEGTITYSMTRFTTAEIGWFADGLERCLTLAVRDASVTVQRLTSLLRGHAEPALDQR